MAIKIKYIKQFTKEYKDFIIVLSKLSELKNIDNLPFNTKLLYKNQTLEKNLDLLVYLLHKLVCLFKNSISSLNN